MTRNTTPHEFETGLFVDYVGIDPERCRHCGEAEDHANHKNDDGTPFYDTDTDIDRMRYDGTVAPRTR